MVNSSDVRNSNNGEEAQILLNVIVSIELEKLELKQLVGHLKEQVRNLTNELANFKREAE